MKLSPEKKAERLEELFAQKRAILEEINRLLEPEKETVRVLPSDFSIYDEIERILEGKMNGMLAEVILQSLRSKYPSYGITQKQVTAAMVYLSNKRKTVDRIGRGLYKLKIKSPE